MKKQVFILSALFIVVFSLVSCSSNDEYKDGNEKKYLAEITIKEYPWKFGERSNKGELYENYKYDNKGNLIEKKKKLYVFTYKYEYSYDIKNRLIVMNEYEEYSFNYKYKYQYNAFDSVATMQKYNKDGQICDEKNYEYDSNHKLSKITESHNIINYIYTYQYEPNKTIEVKRRLDNNELFGTMIWEYDNHNNLLKETWINGENGKSTIQKVNSYEYNTKGQMTRWIKTDIPFTNRFIYHDYYYNDDGTIEKIHLSYSFKDEKSDLIYTYTWK